ncbi:hypothetical protein V8E51_001292 [Hyaloscypha variabilis]
MASQYWIPPEVWTIIFQIISEEDDIKNVRLTCKVFEELETPFLLPRVICAPLSSSLATLTAVSRYPVFSRSVMEVVYVCNRYHFIKTLREYKEALRRASLFGKFEEPKSEEEDLDKESVFSALACLCSALMRMLHIERVTISPNFDCYPEGHRYSRYSLEPDPGYNEADLEIERDDECGRGLEGMNRELFRGMSDINLNHCYDVEGWMTGNLAKILLGATGLERLRVYGCYLSFHISTKYILREFLHLLKRHSGTLKDIDLFCVCLRNSSWKLLLEEVKSSLSLRCLSIDHPSEDGEEIYLDQHALDNYLFGDGPHPLSE